MNYVPRSLATTMRRAMATFPAVLVTGARQAGKTTMLREELGATHAYLSLERPDVRNRVIADPVGFVRGLPDRVILDEIQYLPELLHYIKEHIDADRAPGRWLFTGSQSFGLMQGVSQSLAGRVAVLHLDPLSTVEVTDGGPVEVDEALSIVFDPARRDMADARTSRQDLVDWLLRGGYPEPRLNLEVDRRLWFGSYVQTYLERDVRDLLQVGDLATFGRFLSLVAARTGSVLNMTELGREIGVRGPTVRRWLSVLETSGIIVLLRPFHRNLGKRIRKSPKLYVLDPGLATFLLGLHDAEAIAQGPSIGALAETAVVSEWVKLFRQAGERPSLYYWRTSHGLEVDLVIERSGQLYGIEVKATETPRPRHAEALATWMELAGPGTRGVLACSVSEPVSVRPGVQAVPWNLAWVGGAL